jgi:hypothetical protein
MLPRSRVDFIPAGKAPQRGADAVKASYPLSGSLPASRRCESQNPFGMRVLNKTAEVR